MSVEETTTESWGDRIKSSLAGFVLGPILILAAFPVQFCNEGNAVDTFESLGQAKVAMKAGDSKKVDKSLEGEAVDMTGPAETKETLADTQFGISLNAIKLMRTVEMYQWEQKSKKETKKKVGGKKETKTTYWCEKTWASKLIDASGFKDKECKNRNPRNMPYKAASHAAKKVSLNAFKLTSAMINQMSGAESLSVKKDALKKLPPKVQKRAKLDDGSIYIAAFAGGGPSDPSIGDVRVSFKVVKPGDVSVLAQQKGDSFVPWKAKAGKDILDLRAGIMTGEQMIAAAESEAAMMLWIGRIAAFLMLLIGFNLLFKPLAVLGDVVPFIGSIIGTAGFVVALLLSAVLWLLSFAIAWIAAAPLRGIIFLVIAIGGIVGLVFLKKKKGAAPAAEAPAA